MGHLISRTGADGGGIGFVSLSKSGCIVPGPRVCGKMLGESTPRSVQLRVRPRPQGKNGS